MSLLRTAHESALVGLWLVEPGVSADERRARGVAASSPIMRSDASSRRTRGYGPLPTTWSTAPHARAAAVTSPPTSASPASTSRSTAARPGPSRPTPPDGTERHDPRRPDPHPAQLLRARDVLSWRPGARVRAEARPRRVLVGQRLAAVLRQPRLPAHRPAALQW